MRIAIVDDIHAEREQLRDFVTASAERSQVDIEISLFDSGSAFVRDAHAPCFDMVFLDIYMDGMTGMDVAIHLRERGSQSRIIFCTTSDNHAIQSYDVDAFYYLKKPYSQEKLSEVFERAVKSCGASPRHISVKGHKLLHKILLSDIIYVDYSNHYTHIHLENETVKTYGNFRDIGDQLAPYRQFLLCYRNIMINMHHVRKVEPDAFTMANGDILPINRKEKQAIRQVYADFIFSEMTQGGNDDR